MKTDIQQLISKMSELEIVDSFNAIERHILEEIQVMSAQSMVSSINAPSAQNKKVFRIKHAISANILVMVHLEPLLG